MATGLYDHLIAFLSAEIEDPQERHNRVQDAFAGQPILQALMKRYEDPATPADILKVAQLRAVQQVLQTRAIRYADRDLQTLVWLGRHGEALNYARLRPTHESKFQSLLLIWQALSLKTMPDHITALKHLREEILEELASASPFVHSTIRNGLIAELVKDKDIIDSIIAAVQTIEDVMVRIDLLVFIGQELQEDNDDRAQQVLNEAEKLLYSTDADTDSLQIVDSDQRLLKLITSLAESQRYEEAESLVFDIGQEARDLRLSALRILIRYFPQDHPGQSQFLSLAEEICDGLGDSEVSESSWRRLALDLVESQQYRQASRIALRILNPKSREYFFRSLAEEFAKHQQYVEAAHIILHIPNQYTQDLAWNDLSQLLSKNQRYASAARVALRIKTADRRMESLSVLAEQLVEGGHPAALRLIELVEKGSRTLSEIDVFGRLWVLYRLMGPMVQIGLSAEAEQVCLSIGNLSTQGAALRTLVLELAKREHYAEAERVALSIKDKTRSRETFSLLSQLLSERGRADAARLFKVVEGNPHETEQTYFWAKEMSFLALSLTRSQHYVQAERVAQNIEEVYWRSRALINLVETQCKLQHYAEAERLALSIEYSDRRCEALISLARYLANAVHPDRHRLHLIAEDASTQVQEISLRARLLSELVGLLPQVNHPAPERLFKLAEEVARSIDNKYGRGSALKTLIDTLIESRFYLEAEGVASRIQNVNLRANTLKSLAEALGQRQNYGDAARIAYRIDHLSTRVSALSTLAYQLTQAGHPDQERLFKLVEEMCFSIEDIHSRDKSLQSLAVALEQSGQFSRAENIARRIENADTQSWVLRLLAGNLAEKRHYIEAERVALSIVEDAYDRKSALKALAENLRDHSQYAEAERVAYLIDDSHDRNQMLESLVKVLGEKQQYIEAERIAVSIEEPDGRVSALIVLAETMVQTHHPDRHRLFVLIEETWHTNEEIEFYIISSLIRVLARDYQYDRAEHIAGTIRYEQDKELRSLAYTMAENRSFVGAFRVLPHCPMLDYVSLLCNWRAPLDAIASGLFLNVLRVTLPILAWEEPQWGKLAVLLDSSEL